MKIKITAVFCLVLTICICVPAVHFSASAAETPYITEVELSSWARDGVSAAYEAGLVAQEFDLGDDYSLFITRVQLARLAVDFVAAEKNLSVLTLADEFELDFQDDTAADEAVIDSPTGIAQSEQTTLPELLAGSFPDTKSPYAELALKLNIMQGSGRLFRPDDTVTRAEATAVLQRSM
ncbi:MAG: S-layer homology domain-containing protein, partial [Clostridiales bacterium]|nr:S-layer homology domain-containing protein [Clostridiales bacterium]